MKMYAFNQVRLHKSKKHFVDAVNAKKGLSTVLLCNDSVNYW